MWKILYISAGLTIAAMTNVQAMPMVQADVIHGVSQTAVAVEKAQYYHPRDRRHYRHHRHYRRYYGPPPRRYYGPPRGYYGRPYYPPPRRYYRGW
ncbi:hypothetical protein WJT86_06490 [Microvirga sp. W0021]|uniref:Uncharacterized protein n=1 Tax=Hohaiivirga grylli TaxID=3133970 RepID=A0ABV0BMD5_9HYPH